MNKPKKNNENKFWSESSFVEEINSQTAHEKMKSIHKNHDENMKYNCKKCNAKISAHNKDWHAGLCDDCFFKMIEKV